MHLMSLLPSVGFMYFKPLSRSRFCEISTSNRSCNSEDHGRVLSDNNNCSNNNSLVGAWQVRLRPPALHQGGVPRTKQHKYHKGTYNFRAPHTHVPLTAQNFALSLPPLHSHLHFRFFSLSEGLLLVFFSSRGIEVAGTLKCAHLRPRVVV